MYLLKTGKWDEREVEILLKNFKEKRKYKEISAILNRSVDSIGKKLKSMGLTKKIEKKSWSFEEINFLKTHFGVKHIEEIGKELKRSKDSIQKKAISLGLKGMIQNEWIEEEIDFLKNNFENMTLEELSKALKRTKNSIQLKANRIGLKRESYKKFDKDFFDIIDTEEKAYWLGFIYADGYVSIYNRNYEFGIELSKVDVLHLDKLNKSMNSNVEISIRKREGRYLCNLRFSNKNLVESLIDKGVFLNKTNILKFPSFLEKSLTRHFIRGFFDGDGYVSFNKRKYGYTTRTGFVCNSLDFTKSILNVISNILDEEVHYYMDKKSYCFDTSNQRHAKKLLDYMYKDSTIYLERKYIKYLQIIEYLNNKGSQ